MARERQRRRRAKLSDEQLESKRKYDRDRRDKLKKENKIKTVTDMTPRERRKMQKNWREQNKERSLKNKALKMLYFEHSAGHANKITGKGN